MGDCVKLAGTPDRPQATKAECGSPASNFKVVDIDWVIGGCMSVDPTHNTDPFRVDCDDASVPHRQRATQILKDLDSPVSVDQCASGVGYVYTQRRFAVCVEDVTGGPRS
ncbi:lipoprotein LppU [Mycobacterium tuberculosis]|nr:lipoprotein LppU [Mycobacterium tuberculosis]